MFEIKHLYAMLKDKTAYDIVIGGTEYSANFVKGVVILSLVNSEVLTSQSKEWISVKDDDSKANISESSVIQYNFQLDIYKKNDENIEMIQAFNEAIALREALKGLDIRDYLHSLASEILPNYSIIQFTTEAVDNKVINRAFFEFSIVSRFSILESDSKIENIAISDKIL